MRNLMIIEAISTGYNYVEDAVRRGFHPVVMEKCDQEVEGLRDGSYACFTTEPEIIRECETWEDTLALVKSYDPVLIVPGSESGVGLSTKLSAALGLPGNPVEILEAMTKKNAMHEALKKAGIRYIRGEKVHSTEEAIAFCEKNGLTCAVVKPLQSAGSQGLYLCDNLEEVRKAVTELMQSIDVFGRPIREALVQERIFGTEYIVNTLSSEGRHRLNSILRYEKKKTEEGGYIYDYIEFITRPEAGHTKLVEYALQVADAIGYRNGMIHGEYMIDEKGPVLIEVNCRPMGCTMPAEYLDLVLGQHETDSVLDTLLHPERFEEEMKKPYRPRRKAYLKLIMIPEDIEAENHPIWEVARQLRSTFKIVAKEPNSAFRYTKTRDLESAGGIIFMVHDDEEVVESDLRILRQTEKNFFKLLLNDGMSRRWFPDEKTQEPDYAFLFKEGGLTGAVLLAMDHEMQVTGAQCVTPATLSDAHKGFDYVIIGYRNALLQLNENDCLKLLFDTMSLVREGGKVIIPKTTYDFLSYGREGAEHLMLIKGLTVDPPISANMEIVVGTAVRL